MTAQVLGGARLPGHHRPVALRIDDGRITAMGSDLGPPDVDLGGRVMVRGLVDAHTHIGQWAIDRRSVDVSGCHSAVEAGHAIRAGARPDDDVVLARGMHHAEWPDRPTAAALDVVSRDRPVVVSAADLHAVWLNTVALSIIGRTDSDGLLLETDGFTAMTVFAEVQAARLDAWSVDALADAAARGVTALIDFELTDTMALWSRRAARSDLPVRVHCATPHWLLADVGPGREGDVIARDVVVGPVKAFVDGSLNSRTALCSDPWPDGGHGRLETSPEQLDALIEAAAAAGRSAAIHAIGDRAVTLALDAFARTGRRGRIEHAQLIDPADLPRLAGVTLGVQPAHLDDDRDVMDRLWARTSEHAFALADLHAAGAVLEFGSDAPVSPLDPWCAIATAVTRRAGDRPAWHPEQALPVAVALDASCGGRHRPAVGDVADLAVLDDDPFVVPADELRELPVAGTLLAGRWTHRTF